MKTKDKQKQKQLLIELMNTDHDSGLYDLSRADVDQIIRTCENPPEPNSTLRKTAKRYMSKDNLYCYYSDLPSPMSYIKTKKNNMTKEQAKDELIEVLMNQIVDLTMMSKIELGDDVIAEIARLKTIINEQDIRNI